MKAVMCALALIFFVPPAFADEAGKTYGYKGITFIVSPPSENGRMSVESSGTKARVGVDAFRNVFDPNSTPTAKEALDAACQRILDALERRKIEDKNRPHLLKELNDLYTSLPGKANDR